MLSLRFQFLFAARARFALQHHQIRNDVRGHAALDQADVRGGFFVDAAELHRGQPLGRDLDGRNTVLGRDAGVRFQAVNSKLHVIGRRPFGEQETRIV